MTSRVAIAGAGMVGTYAYRLLQRSGISADIYGDQKGHGVCGIHPCAWGTTTEFPALVRAAGLDPNEYIFRIVRAVNFEGVDLKAHLMTFNKPKLVRDLLAGEHVIPGAVPPGRYERIIDATGVARAYLPPAENEILIPCVQHKVRSKARDSTKFVIKYGNIGYCWAFPLAGNEFHIGAGSLLEDPKEMLTESGLLDPSDDVICGCSGTVRSTSPANCRPFVVHDAARGCSVWGVGESIGAVGPIAGEGVVPGMTSANLLLAEWDDPDRYAARILRTFSWMAGERKVINKVWRGERLSIPDWIILRGAGKRMGSEVSLGEVRTLLHCLTKFENRAGKADAEDSAPTVGEPAASGIGNR